jgi:hypothetical protein
MRAPLQRPTTYDIEQEQQRHDDAIHWLGEMSCFVLWWHAEDFMDGLVARCSDCYIPYGDVAEAYRQPSQKKCPTCYGTSFEGGIKRLLYRPALWSTTPEMEGEVRRGNVEIVRGTIEMLSNISCRQGDVVVRPDGSRWRMGQPKWQEITTGFGSQKGVASLRIGSSAQVTLEDPSTVSYFPMINMDALNLDGWLPYVPHSPHPLDQEGPPTVIAPPHGTTGLYPLRVERTRLFEFTMRFWEDTERTQAEDVSGNVYRSEMRTAVNGGDLIATMTVDMTNAATGAVRFWISGVVTTDIVVDAVWVDVLQDLGSENITKMEPRQILVVDVVTGP